MPSGVTISFLVAEALFLGSGILLTVVTMLWKKEMATAPTVNSAARMVLINHFPMQVLLANGILIFFTCLLSIPAMVMPTSRGWLKLHGWFVVICAIMTMVLGINEWLQTLTARANLATIWGTQPYTVQSLLQTKFQCCGYKDYKTPPFVLDSTCPSTAEAAKSMGCIGPFSVFAQTYLNLIFTAAFGIVGLDMVLVLCLAMLVKKRKEILRYRRIDEKRGVGSI